MKIAEQVKQLTVVGDNSNTKKASISADKMAKLQYLLTKGLYRDPITAVIAEWTNNGIDSIVQAGKSPVDNPIMVTIAQNARNQCIFSVEDKGTGLDDREFEEICMSYLESTKEGDNDTIGHFGIGMKSFLSLERSATFTCRKNGKERVYLVYEGEEFVNYDLVVEKDTKEENGVKAELVVNGYGERMQFIQKARQKLAYYDTAVLVIDGAAEVWSIYRNDLFQRSSANINNQMHLCLKDVYYSIDWEALGIQPIGYPIALRFGLDSGLVPTPSRESYITNEKTKKLILNRIKEVADWMITKYNATVQEFPTFKEAYDYLGMTSPTLNMEEGHTKLSYPLSYIAPYSKIGILTPKVKGITIQDPNEYKKKRYDLLYEFIPTAYLDGSGKYKGNTRGHIDLSYYYFNYKYKIVIVNEGMKGNVREYMKHKYSGTNTLFIRPNPVSRPMKDAPNEYISYTHILGLTYLKKEEWQDRIDEWDFVRKSIASDFVDERKVDTTQVYLDWLDKRRKSLYIKKGTIYNKINKQQGDVTMAYLVSNSRGGSGWKKAAYKIADLPSQKFLTILVDDDSPDKDKIKEIWGMMKGTINFALVGKKERKKVPNCSQFINYDRFMSRDCKPFMRLASSLKFGDALTEFDKINAYKTGIFQRCLASLLEDSKVLRDYVAKNHMYTGDQKVREEILAVADKYDLYDKTLWDVYMRLKKSMKKFDFITCLQEPRGWSNEEVEKYNRVINQMLLFRKKYYNDVDSIEITVKEIKK